ncbi:TonB-dependent receptor [Sphingomonas sp. G-3-2-10]|uniref:TonB-dependent receptor n=1 Tax=Sphingomonas sp. G-3-2-10 TaxID=2728838 RepID=UPI00146DD66E|nr:TonB-dependent receptor [Sphingomonas sp. G-3-2-10]NML06871.1 TonB-dependent receptor [Sphingomonas sp. G-3-2-10]
MIRTLLLASAAFIALPAHAEDTPPAANTSNDAPAAQAQDHDQPNGEIVVTGTRARSTADVLGGTAVLANEELNRSLRPTIGETLASQPGVSATSFGPNASKPVLRGFTGDRAPVLTDGIGSIDVSNTSADHAAVINPLTADRIEVLRGPAALLFAPSSIGGVVNVIDSRIPRRVETPVHADGIMSYGSAANERSVSGTLDVPATGSLVFHFDGSYSKTDDMKTGGYVLSPALRAQAAASADPDIAELADLRGTVPNTAARTWNVAGGAAIINDGGSLGFAVSHYDSLYGVPVRYSFDPSVEAEEVRLAVKQTRVDIRGEVNTGGSAFSHIRLRLGAADYKHSELEDTGAVGTTFYNQGYEGRLELVQTARGSWEGLIGGQFVVKDMHIDGDEKFLPKNSMTRFGLFTLQSVDLGALKVEGAARYEHSAYSAQPDADIGNPAYARNFDTFSASAGASYELADRVRFGVNVSRSERAPSSEELFANGPHAGTQAFEVGNPGFTSEKAWGVEATLKGSGDGWSLGASAYHSWYDGFIYDAPTGAIEDDLPVFQYAQADARYYGFEIEGSKRLGTVGGFDLNVDGLADYVHATIVGEGPAPRIPPLRLLGGFEAQSTHLNTRFEVERSFAQNRVTGFETETKGHTLVNASIAWSPWGAQGTSFTLSANNIFNVEARRHSSVLKDYAPLMGRDIRVTARLTL